MQSITFAVPTLATSEMSRQDQIDIVVNQAAAGIICCYLEHMNTAIEKGIPGATQTGTGGGGPSGAGGGGPASSGVGFISTTELVALINDVQGALRLTA